MLFVDYNRNKGQLLIQSFALTLPAGGGSAQVQQTILAGRGNVKAVSFTVSSVTPDEEQLANFTFSDNNTDVVVNANGSTFAAKNFQKPVFLTQINEQATVALSGTSAAGATTDILVVVELYFVEPNNVLL